jgi:predicted transcriptional regulator
MKRARRPPQSVAKPVHVVSSATASEIRRTLGITKANIRNVVQAFRAAGVIVEPPKRGQMNKRKLSKRQS